MARLMARELVSVVPLTSRGRAGISATSLHTPGAVSLTPPRDGINLASTLIHELQHTRLWIVMQLMPFNSLSADTYFYSPWRDDPRPIRGLLHGLYAATALAEFWRLEEEADAKPIAGLQFAHTRNQIEAGLDSLRQYSPTTESGASLVASIAQIAQDSIDGDTSPENSRMAGDLDLDHKIRWKLRNFQADEQTVAHLSGCWRSGASGGAKNASVLRAKEQESLSQDSFLRLVYSQLIQDNAQAPESDNDANLPEFSSASIYLAKGDYANAADGFEAAIRSDADADAAWSGLAVAAHRRSDPAAGPLIRHPELVRAIYQKIVGETGAKKGTPMAVARWMAVEDTLT